MFAKKRAFPPDFENYESNVGKRVWKRQNNPHRHLRHFKLSVAGAGGFLVLAPACAALRFGLLLSALSRLNHMLFPEHPSGRL